MAGKQRKPDPEPCPKCGQSDSVVPILYGCPTREAETAAERGEVSLGGCVVGDVDPTYACHRCDISFGFQRPELAGAEEARRGWIEHREGREQFTDEEAQPADP